MIKCPCLAFTRSQINQSVWSQRNTWVGTVHITWWQWWLSCPESLQWLTFLASTFQSYWSFFFFFVFFSLLTATGASNVTGPVSSLLETMSKNGNSRFGYKNSKISPKCLQVSCVWLQGGVLWWNYFLASWKGCWPFKHMCKYSFITTVKHVCNA